MLSHLVLSGAVLLLAAPWAVCATTYTVTLQPDACDAAGYPSAQGLVLSTNCMVISGQPGLFDDDPSSGVINYSPVKTCPDYGAAGTYCIAEPSATTAGYGWNWNCTDATTPNYGSFSQCAKSVMIYGQPRCSTTAASGSGKCITMGVNKGPDASVAGSLQNGPCSYFAAAMATIPAGSTRAFCIGCTSDTLLMCPGNIVKRCQGKCRSKFDDDAQTMPCGKAACDAKGYQVDIAAVAAVPPPAAPINYIVTLQPDACDAAGYPSAQGLVLSTNCMVISGQPGLFDDDPSAGSLTNSPVKTCPDYGAAGTYCIAEPSATTAGYGWNWNCTDATTPNYGSFLQCPKSVMIYGQPRCSTTAASGSGKCITMGVNKGPDASVAGSLQKGPCSYFATPMATIPAGSRRAFCIGNTSDTVLLCPDNTVKKCKNKCVSKFDDDAKTMPCGKAACDAKGYQSDAVGYH